MRLRQLGSCAIATLFLTGVATAALAQDSGNQSSGSPKSISPEKNMPVHTNRSSNKNNDMNTGSSPAAGRAAIEGPAGSKSGPAPRGSRQ